MSDILAICKAPLSTLTLILAPALICIGYGLGVTLTVDHFKYAFKKKYLGIVVGWISQFLFMPFICYLLAELFGITGYQKLGFILTGATPGGGTSNLFTYWTGGDVSLSITMTTASTICALFMIPVNAMIYLTDIPKPDGSGTFSPFQGRCESDVSHGLSGQCNSQYTDLGKEACDNADGCRWTGVNFISSLFLGFAVMIVPALLGMATKCYNDRHQGCGCICASKGCGREEDESGSPLENFGTCCSGLCKWQLVIGWAEMIANIAGGVFLIIAVAWGISDNNRVLCASNVCPFGAFDGGTGPKDTYMSRCNEVFAEVDQADVSSQASQDLCAATVLDGFDEPTCFWQNSTFSVGWEIYLAAALMQPIGMLFGYCLSWCFMLKHSDARTVSIETGIQNYTFTITLIELVFAAQGDALRDALLLPLMCGLFYFPWSILTIVLYNCSCYEGHDTSWDNWCRKSYAKICPCEIDHIADPEYVQKGDVYYPPLYHTGDFGAAVKVDVEMVGTTNTAM